MRFLLIICLFVLVGHRVESAPNNSETPGKKCEPGTSWQEDCNFCFCLDAGVGACTRKLCNGVGYELFSTAEKPKVPSGNQCLPGSTWKSQCNSCICSDNGLPACTTALCPGYESEPEKICAPNTTWKNDCNSCTCSDNGQNAACTLRGCL